MKKIQPKETAGKKYSWKAEDVERAKFIKEHPYVDMSRFKFEARMNSADEIGVVTWCVDLDSITSYDIKYDGFKKDKE